MASLRFGRVDGPLGPMWVAETDAGLAAVSREDSPEPMLAGLRRRFPGVEAVPDRVDATWLFGGPARRLDVRGISSFDARVYDMVRTVRSGETLTYGEVAALIDSPGAARAVGGAMARCPFFPLVPCHRVVRAADGWSGWGGDDRLKRRLLADEHRAATSRTVRMPS